MSNDKRYASGNHVTKFEMDIEIGLAAKDEQFYNDNTPDYYYALGVLAALKWVRSYGKEPKPSQLNRRAA